MVSPSSLLLLLLAEEAARLRLGAGHVMRYHLGRPRTGTSVWRCRNRLGSQYPGVLGAATLAGVDDQGALRQCDPGQPARQQPDFGTVVDGERPQIDVA